jgi:hypothetical protein
MIIIHDAGCFPRIFEIHLIEVKLFFQSKIESTKEKELGY